MLLPSRALRTLLRLKARAWLRTLRRRLSTPGGLACEITADNVGFSFIEGDNEVTLGGGATISNGQWFGSMSLQLFGEDGVTQYSAKLLDNPSGFAVDGSSASYSGPWEKTEPAPPGELPVPGKSFPEVCMAILEANPRPPGKVRPGFPPRTLNACSLDRSSSHLRCSASQFDWQRCTSSACSSIARSSFVRNDRKSRSRAASIPPPKAVSRSVR